MMEFTGERYVPEVHGHIEMEHIHRYLFALEFADGKNVLDIASGEGYGSAMMAAKAKKVIGVDISAETINYSRKRYTNNNLEFRVGDCANIPVSDTSIDLVVSFETIEHHDRHAEMMKEIKRILKPEGILIISSPDKMQYTIDTGSTNPFHVKELYQPEFKKLLKKHFSKTLFFGQKILFSSSIISETSPAHFIMFINNAEKVVASSCLFKPLFNIAICSNYKLPSVVSSVFEQPIEQSEKVQTLKSQLTEREQKVFELEQEVLSYSLSKSWRITRPLRLLMKKIKGSKK
jgi:ubiquinone/menaquinone biosynthesis C-methylase UbiE